VPGELARRPLAHPGCVDLLRKVEDDLEALRRSGALDGALRQWQQRHPELVSYADANALIGFLRDPDAGPRTAKDGSLAALCIEAANRDRLAAALLLWLMLPGLFRVRGRLVSNALDHNDLDAELLAGAWEAAIAIARLTPNVASRLRHGARRRALAAIRQAEEWAGRCQPLEGEEEEAGPRPSSSADDDVLAEAVRAGVISATEADLFRASRTTVGELRSRLGLSDSGVRGRRHRAKRRLLYWLDGGSTIPR
jgi:DNA-directed RNA polymerase specialized sigma24 family protein